MRQSKNKSRETSAALYVRLSRDDNLEGESYSVSNQKKLLTGIAKEYGYENLLIFCDDGISGVTMNRPGYINMIEAIENNKVSAVFVKDLSRLGRNYIEVGKLTEEFLPDHDIRLIAVSDNIDTDEGENDFAPFKNMFNEMYSRDISKKRRISNKVRGSNGEPLGPPPYGYIKNPDGSKNWVIDEEAAAVVRRIFDMRLEGLGSMQIANILTEEKILTPIHYWASKGINRPGTKNLSEPYKWSMATVNNILSKQEYCGDLINFKTYSKSYKNKKRIYNDPENMVIFKDIHEPIIERSVFEIIQKRRKKNTRVRPKADGEKNIFSGLLVCADCGSNLTYHFNQKNPEIEYFNCSGYNRGKHKICNSTHYIRVDFLEKIVLGEIRRLTKLASQYENEFAKMLMGNYIKETEKETSAKKKELQALAARNNELDNLFNKMYEDNVSGKISDERFYKMSMKYEEEQQKIENWIKDLQTELEKEKNKTLTLDMFLSVVRKYTRVRKLTPRMVNELIEKIEVHQAEKVNGKTVQKIDIYYNCVGKIDIPDLKKIPQNNVILNTRQGVDVHYTSNAC